MGAPHGNSNAAKGKHGGVSVGGYVSLHKKPPLPPIKFLDKLKKETRESGLNPSGLGRALMKDGMSRDYSERIVNAVFKGVHRRTYG